MSSKLPYRIGTRGSLLALTQCTLIKNEIEEKTKKSFELITIKTQGDQIQDKPLWQLEGKDFFTKELDHALLSKDVDLVVHSYKDLGSERPEGIKLRTITKRSFAHDILLMREESIRELPSRKSVVIGTSSPRRTVNLEKNLADFLPHGENIDVQCKSLRGNVNTRIEKLKRGNYDGIVLALAGIERLANKEDSAKILEDLLKGLNFMVLPQTYFPSAASQGALAIECTDDAPDELQKTLTSVHDDLTAEEMKRERAAFASYGGGCHLAVGIFTKKVHDFYLQFHRGEVDSKPVEKMILEGEDYSSIRGKKSFEVFGENDFLISKPKIDFDTNGENLFVTSSHCLHGIKEEKFNSLWAGGNRTMKKLAKRGYWVCGSSDGLGHEIIDELKKSKAIEILLESNKWAVLSHENAESPIGDIIPCYSHSINKNYSKELESKLLHSEVIYWTSFIQFETYLKKYPELKTKIHCSGLGKTYRKIKEIYPNVIGCISMSHYKEKLKED